jgi:hypothetical protein
MQRPCCTRPRTIYNDNLKLNFGSGTQSVKIMESFRFAIISVLNFVNFLVQLAPRAFASYSNISLSTADSISSNFATTSNLL